MNGIDIVARWAPRTVAVSASRPTAEGGLYIERIWKSKRDTGRREGSRTKTHEDIPPVGERDVAMLLVP
jgi:hypothetical protein